MLTVSLALALALLFLSRNARGPVWVASLAWAACIAPIVLGIIDFRFFDYNDPRPGTIICLAMLSFAAGGALELFYRGPVTYRVVERTELDHDFRAMLPVARFCWLVGMVGGACIVLDFAQNGGSGLLNLAELRDDFVSKEAASLPARLGSVMTWACLFSYLFALIFRRQLGLANTIFFAVPVIAFLLGAVLSAGRQATFQVVFITLIGHVLWRIRSPRDQRRGGLGFVVVVAAVMTTYMGYVAIARNDSRVSDVKSEVLARLFDFTLARPFEAGLSALGSGVYETLVEALVYFTSSIALFSRYLLTGLEGVSYGSMNFPFLYRQIEPLTGLSVTDLYQSRVAALDAQQVIGVGWTTTISNLMMDFGLIGALIFLAVQGFVSAIVWRTAAQGGSFLDCVLATIAILAAIYLPLIPAISDSNVFLLLVFCLVVKWFDVRRRGSSHRVPERPA